MTEDMQIVGDAPEIISGSSQLPKLRRKTKPQPGDMRYGRSAVSNGVDVLPGIIDKRSTIYRRFKDISSAIVADLGGVEHCSESRLQLIRRFSAASVIAEQMESDLANGKEINVAEHSTLSSTLVRLASRIGLNRVPKDITPTLGDLLRQDHARSQNHE